MERRSVADILAGLRVFDLSIVTAGAACTQVLADFGAEVIKIEAPGRPDLFRSWTDSADETRDDLYSPPFRTVNRNKKGFAVDLKQPEGLRIARELIATCDVVVENFRQGVMARLGLGFDDLVKIRPDIVLVSVSSQGTTGPNARYGSFGSTLDALGGTMSVTGYDAETPLWSSNKVNYPDQTAALLGPALIVMSVLAARRTGEPRWVEISQRELVTAMLPEEILRVSLGAPDPVPRANRGPDGFEWATPCRGQDDWVAVSAITPAHRRSIAHVIGQPGLAEASDADLALGVQQWSKQRPRQKAVAALQAAGVPAAVVVKGHELHRDPFFRKIDFFKRVPLPGGGAELQRGWIVRMDGGPGGEIKLRAPHVGEHTVEIMERLLRYGQSAMDSLLESGAIGQSAQRATDQRLEQV
jgi:crotonobetainyl-CoA:carnitine CoA-transferase CaiB-like acyl-CoA transferase